ncbi:hypothetical protein DL93DRAFT_2094595 [Clavulina sp. PMI_390]|nr:hypothetical protein DL93DRAFT_2094595 [Clavulina sp. PMI_390]
MAIFSTIRAPVDVLPNELLLLVIDYLLLCAGDSARRTLASLLTITSISTRWRNVALQHGPFWAKIYVKLSKTPKIDSWSDPKHPTRLLESDIDRVRCFLERSKHSPIYVHIPRSWKSLELLPENEQVVVEEYWRAIGELLEPHMERCRSISVHFIETKGSLPLSKLLQPWNFPLLEVLSIQHYDQKREQGDVSLWDNPWSLSPQSTPLQALKFSDPERYLPKAIDVPWPTLTFIELDVTARFWGNVCDTLTQLPTLRELRIALRITASADSISSTPRQPHVLLPLVENVTTNVLTIWYDICTPALHSVTLTSKELYYSPFPEYGGQHDSVFIGLPQLLGEMPVRDLTISACRINHDVILLVLQAFSHVENLNFCDSYGHGKLLNSISRTLEQVSTDIALNSQTATSSEGLLGATGRETILPVLRKVSIEESQTRYSIFWDFPHIWPDPPHSCVRRKRMPRKNTLPKRKIYCDKCRTFMLRCDASSPPGSKCTQCTKRGRDCTFNANSAVAEGLKTQEAIDRLQALGLEVTWVLK